MPRQKDLKRVIRSRMDKTGESYTTARLHLLNNKKKKDSSVAKASAKKTDYATVAGMSDEKVKEKTGCTWEKWVHALDYVDAASWSHRDIAQYIHDKYKISGWWSQMVTVGYERIRGLREKRQRLNGEWEAAKSKTVNAPLSKLYRAFSNSRTRAKWLPGVKMTVRTAIREKSMRITWDDGTHVDVYFTAAANGKSRVAIQHRKLESKEDVARWKSYWGDRLGALAELVA